MPYTTIDGSQIGSNWTITSTPIGSMTFWGESYQEMWGNFRVIQKATGTLSTHPKMSRVRNKLACGMAKYAKYTNPRLQSVHYISLLSNGNFTYYVGGMPRGEYKMTDFIDDDWELVDTLD